MSLHQLGFVRLEKIGGKGQPAAVVLSIHKAGTPDEARELGPEAHRIRRLWRMGGVAVALEEIWLDGAITSQYPLSPWLP